jgi:hypothetical protein
MISGLQELNQLKNKYTDVKIPLEVLDALDEGKNPQLYTATCLERTLQKNKEVCFSLCFIYEYNLTQF